MKSGDDAVKTVKLGNDERQFLISGVAADDPYFQSISDGFETDFFSFCRSYLREDYVVFDIGANIGVTSAIMSNLVPQGQIFAFEPGPGIFDILCKNIERNGLSNVRPQRMGVGNSEGFIQFTENSAFGHISPAGGISVPVSTLDSLVQKLELNRLDFCKIDVEGFEWAVLQGAQNTINLHRPLIYLEFNSFCQLAYGGVNPLEFLNWLLSAFSHVYAVKKPNGSERLLRRLAPSDAIGFLHQNLVFHGCLDDLVVTNDDSRVVAPC